MKFFRVYIELTNVCRLKFFSSPTKNRIKYIISLEFLYQLLHTLKFINVKNDFYKAKYNKNILIYKDIINETK